MSADAYLGRLSNIYDGAFFYNITTRNYCNNLATRVIPFFIISKSSVDETISKTVAPHSSKDPVTPMT